MSIFKSRNDNSLIQPKTDPWYKRAWKWSRHQLFNTSAEIWIGVTLGLVLAGGLSTRHYASKAGEIPLAFSEIEQISADFNKASQPVPALTRFYASNNDITMKVFESNNIALHINKSHTVFAHELQTRVDASLKKHALLSEYTATMPQDSRAALESVAKLEDATRALPAIKAAFDDSWSYHRRDVTRTRHYTTQSCSNGKCTTHHHTEQVYDYSWHTYTFNQAQAQQAVRLLQNFMERNPDLSVQERLYIAKMTHGENEQAIRESMARELKEHVPTADEYLKFANTWASGSNYLKYAPQAAGEYQALTNLTGALQQALGTARNHHYRTNFKSDSGPAEYQLAETAETRAARTIEAAHGVTDGIHFSAGAAPQLERMIRDYVDVVLHEKPGNANELRSDIMKTARSMYDQNYENGFDVHTFKWLNVILITMLGMAAGGGLGVGADKLLHRKRREWFEDPVAREEREARERNAAYERQQELERKAAERVAAEAQKKAMNEAVDDLKDVLKPSTDVANDDAPQDRPAFNTKPNRKINL